MTPRPHILRLAAGLVLSVATAAFGQNALGDGRGLEKDFRLNGTGNTPKKNFRDEVQRRNAVVTGEIGGGKAFRGSAGYRSPTDFRGSTAGDSTFAFRRDSMSSRVVSSAVRGTDSVRFQYMYSTGNVRTLDRLTDKPLSASISGATADNAEKRGLVTPDRGALRSTALYSANRELRPSFLGYRQTRQGSIDTVTGSSLIGVKNIPAVEEKRELPPVNPLNATSAQAVDAQAKPANYRSSYEGVRAKLDLFAGPKPKSADVKTDTPAPGLGNPGAAIPGNDKPATNLPFGTPPAAEPSADPKNDQPPVSEWQERLDALRDQLGGAPAPKDDEEAAPKAPDKANSPAKPTEYVPGAWRDRQTEEKERASSPLQLDDRTLQIIRAAGGIIGNLGFGDGEVGDPFTLHMRQGQRLLQDELYFDAEERFSRALTYTPGDEMALVGRIHAQIGAGLSVSAAINLQDLLTHRPELIAVRYTGGSIPVLARLKVQADMLRERIKYASGRKIDQPRDAAILLAYVAYQAGLTEDISPALDVFEKGASVEEANLAKVLREVWLNPPAEPLKVIELPATPVPQPAPTPEPGK